MAEEEESRGGPGGRKGRSHEAQPEVVELRVGERRISREPGLETAGGWAERMPVDH